MPRSQVTSPPTNANHAINLQNSQANQFLMMQLQMQNEINKMNMNSVQNTFPSSIQNSTPNSARPPSAKPPLSVASARELSGQGFPVMT